MEREVPAASVASCRALRGGREMPGPAGFANGPRVHDDTERRIVRLGLNLGRGTIFAAMGFGDVSRLVARELSGADSASSDLYQLSAGQLSAAPPSEYAHIFPPADAPFDPALAKELKNSFGVRSAFGKLGTTTAADRLSRARTVREISALWAHGLLDSVSPWDINFILRGWDHSVAPKLAWRVVRKLWAAANTRHTDDMLSRQYHNRGSEDYVAMCKRFSDPFAAVIRLHAPESTELTLCFPQLRELLNDEFDRLKGKLLTAIDEGFRCAQTLGNRCPVEEDGGDSDGGSAKEPRHKKSSTGGRSGQKKKSGPTESDVAKRSANLESSMTKLALGSAPVASRLRSSKKKGSLLK